MVTFEVVVLLFFLDSHESCAILIISHVSLQQASPSLVSLGSLQPEENPTPTLSLVRAAAHIFGVAQWGPYSLGIIPLVSPTGEIPAY